MARINITLDQDETLALLDAGTADGDRDGGDGEAGRGVARTDVFRRILESTLNGVLRAESAAQLHVAPYERTGERTYSRNGIRRRSLATGLGVLGLDVPHHRSEPFQTRLFDNYSRSEAALVTTMAEMVVMGVSTRKVARVVEELCGRDVSKSVAGEACKSLDKEVEAFRERPIEDAYPFLAVDATYLKVRVDHRIVADYRDVAEQAATCLDEGLESAMSVMQMPAGMRAYMRTNNRLERLNREIKRRTRVIGVFPNTDAAVRMAGSVLIEQNRLAQARKAIFTEETYHKLMQSDTVARLRDIAREQAMLRAA